MLKYKVYADAAADVPAEAQKRYHIHTLPIPVAVGDITYQSGVDITNEEFYGVLDQYEGIPVTSQITPYAFEELFEKELVEGTQELFLFLINSKGSATYNNAVSTRERFYEEHEGSFDQMKIRILDGSSYTGGYGYAAIIAAQKLEMGMNPDEVAELAEGQIKRQRVYFGLYTLKYAGKSGRIPGAAVFVGEALGIKPIMKVGNHSISTIGKARGEKKLIKEIAKTVLDDMEPSTPYSIAYGSDLKARDEMEAEMIKRVGYPPVYHFQIGPAIAINAGHRAVGVVFEVSKKRAEKEAKNKEK